MTEWWQHVDCTGRTVLDVGGYDGGWGAKPALERGAVSAVVVDNGEWEKYGWNPPAPEHPDIVFVNGDLFEWKTPADIVIASNVIYHLRYPIGGLKHLRKLTRECLVIRTSTPGAASTLGVGGGEEGSDWKDRNGWRWYRQGSGHPNGTVWARPTPAGLQKTLKRVGFPVVQEIDGYGGYIVVCRSG